MTQEEQIQPTFISGSVDFASAKVLGRVFQKVSQEGEGENATGLNHISITGRAFLEFTAGREITGFTLSPVPGVSLRGGSAEGASGLSIGRAFGLGVGSFSQIERTAPGLQEQITRLSGRLDLGAERISGTGQIVIAGPGFGLSIAFGRTR